MFTFPTNLLEKLITIGYHLIAANEKTQKICEKKKIPVRGVEGKEYMGLKNGKIHLVLDLTRNDPKNYFLRRNAVDYNVPLLTNLEQIQLLIQALEKTPPLHIQSYNEYF